MKPRKRLLIRDILRRAWLMGASSFPISTRAKSTICRLNVWKVLYPFPYEAVIRREAAKNNFDPLLAAGLMRQESTFQADALSPTNAIGLMQVEPKTGKLLARQLRVSFSTKKLFDPEYNIRARDAVHLRFGEVDGSARIRASGVRCRRRPHRLRGKPSATTTKSPNLWNPSLSARRAITCKSSCAIPKSTG